MIWSNKHFLNKIHKFKPKQGVLVLTGGGDDSPKHAIDMAKLMFKCLNAKFDIDKNYIYSLNTNTVAAKDDEKLKMMLEKDWMV